MASIKVFEGDTLASAEGRAHMKRLVKVVRENDALSRGRKRANRTGAHEGQRNWSQWIAATCPNVPRDEYAGEGGRMKRLALLAAAGDEPAKRQMARYAQPKAGKRAKAAKQPKQKTITIG